MKHLQVSKTGMTTSLRLGSETAFEFDQLEVSLLCIAMLCHLMAVVQELDQAGHCAAVAQQKITFAGLHCAVAQQHNAIQQMLFFVLQQSGCKS